MESILEKVSSYNIFNYLFPGVIFVTIANQMEGYKIPIDENWLQNAFVFYFIGMVISRLGSLVIEPLMLKSGFIARYDYKKYISASIKDNKIETILEVTNTYRTILALFASIFLLKGYELLESNFCFSEYRYYILSVIAFVVFIFSYRKQSDFISKRVEAHTIS